MAKKKAAAKKAAPKAAKKPAKKAETPPGRSPAELQMATPDEPTPAQRENTMSPKKF